MKRRTELLVSITAMITAVVAVVVAVVQTQVMQSESEAEREHQRLSVKPSLWVSRVIREDQDEGSYAFVIRNQGLGPATIEKFSVAYNDQFYRGWDDLFSAMSLDVWGEDRINGRQFPALSNVVAQGHVIPVDSTLTPIQVNGDREILELLFKGRNGLKMSVCYCSFYGECWQTGDINERPKSVKMCEAEAPHFNSSTLR